MSHIFRIGDRVRVVRRHPFKKGPCKTIAELGCEAIITGTLANPSPGFFTKNGSDLSVFIPSTCESGMVHHSMLEPILPPKSQIHEILAMKDLPNRDCKIARVGECV